MSAKYYIRPRAETNIKLWMGPFDTTALKELAERRKFSKELHEYSEDRLNWISARQIWPTLFPKAAKGLTSNSQSIPLAAPAETAKAEQVAKHEEVFEETAEWYCATDGAQQGPFTASQLRSYVAEGRVQPTDLVWCPSFGEEWVEAQTVPDIMPARGISQTDRAPSGKVLPLAVISFVCGLLGATCLPGLASILAIVLGHIALVQYGRQSSKDGRWMAITGLILGYLIIAALFVAGVVYIAMRTM